MFTDLLQFIASGAVLYVLLGMALVLGVWAVWKLPHIINLLLWPVRWLMGKIDRGPVGAYVKQTRPWLWLQKQEYDPPRRPLSWWATRGALVLALWAGSCAWALQYGRELGREEVAVRAPVKAKSAYRKPATPKAWWE